MLLMIEKGIRGGITYVTNMYLVANNLYGWAMSQKLPVNSFKWKINISIYGEEFIKSYDENRNKGYILKVDVKYPKYLHDLHEYLHSDLPFLPERMKVNKCNKFVCNLYNKKTMLST